MVIPNEVKNLFEKQSLVAFSTASREGTPNVVPIFWKKIIDSETILLLDKYMGTTKKNLQKNKRVCLAVWDAKTEEAYKVKGVAKYHLEGAIYEQGKRFMQLRNPKEAPRGVVEIKVKEIYIIKPGPDAGKKL